jgi:hypothetical protein
VSSCRAWRAAALLLALLFAAGACTPLPQPFRNRPGAQAQRLATPLALRLAVPPPRGALLPDAPARALADRVAAALQAQEVPAVATDAPLPLDWRVEIAAERRGASVLPRFRLLDADNRPQAAADGAPVPLRDWSEPTPETLSAVAAAAAPALQRLLLQVEAARKATDPASLAAGPPRIRVGGVRGAPGDGNTTLAARIREQLGAQGFAVQDSAEAASYAVEGEVAVAPPARGVQRVEIQWIVSRRDGEELGRVAQLNEVPSGPPEPLLGRHRLRRGGGGGGRRADGGGERHGRAARTSDAPSGLPPARPGAAAAAPHAPRARPAGRPGARRAAQLPSTRSARRPWKGA